MPQKGSSRKGMRRRSKLPTAGTTGSAAADDSTAQTNEDEIRSYLYDVVKLEKEEEPVAAYRVEGSLPDRDVTQTSQSANLPSSLQMLVVDEALWANSHQIKRQAKGIWRWGAVVLSLLIISLLLAHWLSQPDVAEKPTGLFLDENLDDVLYDEAVAPLMSDNRTHAKALKLIDRFVKAQSWEEAEPLLRESESLRINLLRYWKPCFSLPQTQNSEQLTIDYGHSGKVGFYMIEGRCMDNSPFLFFFVQSSGKLKIDWEASMSLGEKTIEELIRHPLAEPTVMRVVVERSPYYLPDLKEQDFESFRLTIPGDENVIWGYAQRGSPQVSALEKVLQQGGILVEGSHSGRATVRLTATEDKKASKRFFISEVIHPNWVLP